LKKFVSTYLSWARVRIIAEYVAIILLFWHLLPEHLVENWKENGLAAMLLLGVCLILALVINMLDQKKAETKRVRLEAELKDLQRMAAYTEIFRLLNEGFSQLHNGLRSELAKEELKMAFKDFCTKLSYAFEKITGTECHVCIKIPLQISSGRHSHSGSKTKNKLTNLKAHTFVRDSLRGYRDKVDAMKISHLITENSDYEYIFNNINSQKARYYFSNSLPAVLVYKNTSFLAGGEQSNSLYFRESVPLDQRRREWPLHYRSCITVPICPGINSQQETATLIGFLCVDSIEENVFNEKVDPEIICGCADGLYNPLKMYIEQYYIKSPNYDRNNP
jgi:hypothetical protein